MSVGPSTIGERIRQLRLQRDPQMTQRELAERAGVSVDLISKLEQGRKQTALLVSLHKIARALDVDASMLLARPSRIDVADDAQDHGVLAIRRAITAVREDDEPAGVSELEQSARYAWSAYWTNRFDVLGGLLPGFIGAARATARATTAPEVFAVLSDAYGVAASTLVHLGTSIWRTWRWTAPPQRLTGRMIRCAARRCRGGCRGCCCIRPVAGTRPGGWRWRRPTA